MESKGRLELVSTIKLKENDELYKLVDFLNRNLKQHNIMFGLSKQGSEMTFNLYET